MTCSVDRYALVAIVDSQGRIVAANDNFCELCQFSRDELLGQPYLGAADGCHSPEFIRDVWTSARRAGVWQGELRRHKKDGSSYWSAVTLTAGLNDAGEPARYVSVGARIPAPRQGGAAAYLAALIDTSSDAIVGKDMQGIVTSWNHGAEATFGYSAEEMIGKPITRLIPPERLQEEAEILCRVRRDEAIRNFDTVRLRKDGSTVDVSVSVSAIKDSAGRVIGASKVARDIGERKRAEEQIRVLNVELERRVLERTTQLEVANLDLQRGRAAFVNLFESLPGLYLVLTPDLKIVTASDAYLTATMTTAEGIVGRGIFEVFPDDPNDPAATGVANLKASFERVTRSFASDTMAIQKYAVERTDGTFEERYWSPINSPVFSGDRRLEYIVHRVEDVTDFVLHKSPLDGRNGTMQARMEQMEAEIYQSTQKVQATNGKLQEANKELEAFSYSVSHDLRAPLRAVDGFAQALLEDFGSQLPAEGHRQLTVIRDSTQRMGKLIDDLLRFSQLNRQSMKRQRIDMDDLVHETLEELKTMHAGRGIQITVGELSPCEGDRTLLKQVCLNLLSNAFKYSCHRERAIVEIGSLRQRGERAYFVRDNGCGFDMRYADKLFGVFQRLHRANDYEGTGVGLAIAQRIIHRHGGKVWAESELDGGAVFYFTVGSESASM